MGVLLLGAFLAARVEAGVLGRVIGRDGRPIGGAKVAAYALEVPRARASRLVAGTDRVPVASATTAADGSFRLERLPAVVDVMAAASGYAPGFARLADGEVTTLTVTSAPTSRGRVLAAGRPLAGATVVWMSSVDGEEIHELMLRTGPDGGYDVPAPEGWATGVLVIHSDFAPLSSERGVAGWGPALRHDLDPGVAVSGRVLNEATGQGVAGATLLLDGWPLGRAAADGSFLVRRAPRAWTTIEARTEVLAGSARPRRGSVVVRAAPLRRLSGTVFDRSSGRPLAGAVVTVRGGHGHEASAETDASGRYELSLPEGRYSAQIARPGFASAFEGGDDSELIDLRRSPALRRDFRLASLQRLSGRVEDEAHRPVGGALVRLSWKEFPRFYTLAEIGRAGAPSTWTATDGTFTLAFPGGESEENEWTVIALKPGHAMGIVEPLRATRARSPLVVVLPSGVEMTGHVTDPEGAPIPGVAVVVAEASGFLGIRSSVLAAFLEQSWTQTDAAGRFVTRVRPSAHEILFLGRGRSPKAVRRYDPSSGAALDVVLERAAEIRGRVLHADGTGASDVQLFAWGTRLPIPATATTASDGTFALEGLTPGPYQVQLVRNGLPVGPPRSSEAPTSDLRIEMEPTGGLRGRVVDAQTRQPVVRFEVSVQLAQGSERGPGLGPPTGPKDAETGTFELADVPLGEVTLAVRAEGFVTRRVEGLAVTAEGDTPELEIALEPGITLRGRVTSEDGEPLADVRVALAQEEEELSAESDGRGEYELTGVPAGPVELTFVRSGFRSARRHVDAGEGARVDVSLSRGIALSGVVLADGSGVAKAEVWARSSVAGAEQGNAVTDRTGRFTMPGLSPGRYAVSARGPDGGEAEVEDVDVERAGVLRLALRRAPTAVLVGRVVGLPESEDEQLVFVQAHGEQGSESARVDAAGAFRMEKVPAGHVRVQATAVSLGGSAQSSRVNEIDLAPGSESEVVLEFSDDIVVSGTVTRDGLPAVGAVVSFRAGPGRVWAPADGSGRYTVVGLEPGLYQVDVAGPELSFETEYQVTTSAQLDIDASGAAVAGSVTDATTGAPIAGAEVSLWRVDAPESRPSSTLHTGAAGTFVAKAIREGHYRLLASKDGYGQDVLEVDLRRGLPSEVAFELAPAEGLTVEVVDARDGRPLDAVVVVRDTSRRIIANRHSGVGADGTLTIPLAAGSYLLSTSADGYGTATLSVTAPGRGLRVPLTPGGTLVVQSPRDLHGRLRLVRPDGEEYVRCWCNGIATMDLEGRRTTIPNVTPDRYTVELLDTAGRPDAAPRAVVIQEGQVSTLTVE